MRITHNDTAALIIDIQNKLFPYIHNNKELTDKNIKLIKGLKLLKIPLIVTEQYSKGLGSTIKELQIELQDDYNPLEKMTFSCCADSNIDNQIKNLKRKNIIIAGIEAHVCVLQTVIDLCEKGLLPVVVEDCISSRNPNDKAVAVERMIQEGAVITTCESILFELLEVSGTEQFKAISKIIK